MTYPGRVIEEYDNGAIVAVGEPGSPTYGHQWVPRGGWPPETYQVGSAAPLALEYTKAPSNWLNTFAPVRVRAQHERALVASAWRKWCLRWGVR